MNRDLLLAAGLLGLLTLSGCASYDHYGMGGGGHYSGRAYPSQNYGRPYGSAGPYGYGSYPGHAGYDSSHYGYGSLAQGNGFHWPPYHQPYRPPLIYRSTPYRATQPPRNGQHANRRAKPSPRTAHTPRHTPRHDRRTLPRSPVENRQRSNRNERRTPPQWQRGRQHRPQPPVAGIPPRTTTQPRSGIRSRPGLNPGPRANPQPRLRSLPVTQPQTRPTRSAVQAQQTAPSRPSMQPRPTMQRQPAVHPRPAPPSPSTAQSRPAVRPRQTIQSWPAARPVSRVRSTSTRPR